MRGMDAATITRLNTINRDFYAVTADAFDATRGTSWPGWEQVLDGVTDASSASGRTLRVLDVGCGNGRFGVFLAERLAGRGVTLDYTGVDSNARLLHHAQESLAERAGMVARLMQQDVVEQPLMEGEYDLVTLFGVIHHIPGAAQREHFMQQVAVRVQPGGHLAFAAWCFYESARLRERIVSWPDDLVVEAHDYLLDWRRGERALRYCHYVDETEHERLIQATGLNNVTTYRADGEGGQMNRYSVLRRE
jgi:tRNA (uracil-5-)-methyltransferase TRM9